MWLSLFLGRFYVVSVWSIPWWSDWLVCVHLTDVGLSSDCHCFIFVSILSWPVVCGATLSRFQLSGNFALAHFHVKLDFVADFAFFSSRWSQQETRPPPCVCVCVCKCTTVAYLLCFFLQDAQISVSWIVFNSLHVSSSRCYCCCSLNLIWTPVERSGASREAAVHVGMSA